jgi:hypothetical protein
MIEVFMLNTWRKHFDNDNDLPFDPNVDKSMGWLYDKLKSCFEKPAEDKK